ncbi:MAG: L-aspartate oxidase [Deltaproteobacteria bacterium]|nr:L-aspartate oxidase [Deltaproteobacteria bacterium]
MRKSYEFLVIGSGVAGLLSALKLSQRGSVALVTKRGLVDSATSFAQGGIAAVTSVEDSFEKHIDDTLKAGDDLCDRTVVEMCVREGPERIRELERFGLDFSTRTTMNGTEYDLGREGGHSKRRILHVGDLTGREVEKVLAQRARESENIEIFEHHSAVDLITLRRTLRTDDEDCCLGAYILETGNGKVHTFLAKATILATGGAGKVYLVTSNPDVATGDGIAMAYRAGADVANMEFIQFHPTCLYHPDAKSFLISEAVRGEGAVLRTVGGKLLMQGVHPLKDLAPRDVVARTIDTELKQSGADYVLLDITHKDRSFLEKRFPNIYNACLKYGYDMANEPIPVVPAAHYLCGGIKVDKNGRTNLPGLYAIGETSYTGLHGANRLASNSLLEALVFAHKAAMDAGNRFACVSHPEKLTVPDWDTGWAVDSDESVLVSQNWDEIRRSMWNYVGIVRTARRLARARRRIELINNEIREYYWDFLITSDLIELRNLALVAQLIVESALARQESRGLHYNLDFPEKDDQHYKRPTVLRGWRRPATRKRSEKDG